MCCRQGKVQLEALQNPPQPLRSLLTDSDQESQHFRNSIRAYNNSFAFTSLGAQQDEGYSGFNSGTYTFRVQGSTYHRIDPISPMPGFAPQYAQIYFTDPQYQAGMRRGIFSQLHEPLLERLQEMMMRECPFAQTFEMARQRFAHNEDSFHIMINGRATATLGRTYSAPTIDEVAAIVIDPVSTDDPNYVPHLRRDVATFRRNGTMEHIMSECHRSYDSMHYVLMFPRGENGWHVNMPLSITTNASFEDDDEGDAVNSETDDDNTANAVETEIDGDDVEQEVTRPITTIRRAQQNISVMQFYAHRLQVRPNAGMLHYFGRLFHQYVVDMYVKVEHRRLEYLRNNQGSLRTELYSGLTDAAVSDSTISTEEIGKQIILPSSHTGSPRSMQQLYQDSMAMVSSLGKPSYFITFTCNPNWPEIVNELRNGGLSPTDRPDLCARVFDMKLKELISDIKTKPYIFGNVIGFTHVVEFQKRGLPHAHMVIIVDEPSRPTLETYDKYVSAELPDQSKHPKAYATVVRNMMHTPCGKNINKKRPCLDDNFKCTKQYPKQYAEETFIDSKGFVHYRRRSQPRSMPVKFGDYYADNRWVVPHNLYLVTKYDAHINVEICAGVQAIKYLHKYITKGSDKSQVKLSRDQAQDVNITTNGNTATSTMTAASTSTATSSAPTVGQPQEDNSDRDEISTWVNARYISASEACWRLLGKSLHSTFPSVTRLAVDLPNQHRVYFNNNTTIANVVNAATAKKTTLQAFFELNASGDVFAQNLLYIDVPRHYSFDKKQKKWVKRRRGINSQNRVKGIGRMYFVPPSAANMEKYCMRLLLLHVRGPQSFDNLKNVNGVQYVTFREAAQSMGLLANEDEWHFCLDEGYAMIRTGSSQVRDLFVTILIFCTISTYKQLWDNHKVQLSEDFIHEIQQSQAVPQELTDAQLESCYQKALIDISRKLMTHGKSVKNYPELPQIDESVFNQEDEELRSLFDQELVGYNLETLATEVRIYEERMNADQLQIYNTVLNSVNNPGLGIPTCFFIDGPGGTGKTYLYHALLTKVRAESGIALATASSGIAATLLPGGRTAHSTFKIPLKTDQTSTCHFSKQSNTAKLLKEAKLIIWDEAPMTHKHAFEAVDRSLRDLMSSVHPSYAGKPFGGKVVVLGGDFRQVLPVVKKGRRADAVAASLKASYLMSHTKSLRLTQNMRLTNDEGPSSSQFGSNNFAQYLLRIGEGSDQHQFGDTLAIDPHLDCSYIESYREIIEIAFGDVSMMSSPTSFIDTTILAATNAVVDQINDLALAAFPGESVVYLSNDEHIIDSGSPSNTPVEYLNRLKPSGMPPHELKLKVNQPIMCLRNINPRQGLCNGTRLIVRNLMRNTIEAEIACGSHQGNFVYIPKVSLHSDQDTAELEGKLSRTQFPVQSAFAITINKAQGQTLRNVVVSLLDPVFSHGQLYVALSRVTSLNHLKIVLQKAENEQSRQTINVVYQEILS
ncbi:uncharacterized protein ATC70_009449 [Mucor velutinosus]|uniref:ATP-dependent DNA helicase n=1 Tax=Mucor velutinosus TaxID=708070 RepID=A0AAN7I3C0_9FUNG|nr:hypothetical protein ATC70_009372 [Mucor velutinosus]KAK4519217.1 hypothetical protein ATC70_009449 [Mucor velutinosus]